MPLYFAYGANMDRAAMAQRCPRSKPVCAARLARHRFFIMEQGFASVRRDPGAAVHGVLWDLALADVPGLDKYEELHNGLYAKITQPVLMEGGARRALIYVGASQKRGVPEPAYISGIIHAAGGWNFPEAYLRELRAFAPNGQVSLEKAVAVAKPAVRPRFNTPFDRV